MPGGVKDPERLRHAASRDYVVRRHYTHFDYTRAHLVRATEAREVYLSYRIRDTVFWTRRRIRLHVGELLLTDGKTTARARCGNQTSETAKPEVSDEEPAEDILGPARSSDRIRPVLAHTTCVYPARMTRWRANFPPSSLWLFPSIRAGQ